MPANPDATAPRRRSVNLTIREDVVAAAKALRLNASKAAEAGIVEAIARAREKEWLDENQAAIKAHNARIARSGPLAVSDWAKPFWAKPE